MKKELILISIFLVAITTSVSFVSAGEEVIINLDSPEMGAVLRILHPSSEAVLETAKMKNYNTGVVTANYESTRSKVIFKVLITEGGMTIDDWQSDPLPTNESYELDFRTGAKSIFVKEVPEEAPSAKESVNETKNETNKSSSAQTKTEEETTKNDKESITGNVVYNDLTDSSDKWYFIAGIIAVLSLFTLTGVFLHKKRKKRQGVQVLNKTPKVSSKPAEEKTQEELELEKLERKVQENEGRIRKIKKREDTKRRIDEAKRKISEEESQIREFESKSNPRPQDDNKDNRQWGG